MTVRWRMRVMVTSVASARPIDQMRSLVACAFATAFASCSSAAVDAARRSAEHFVDAHRSPTATPAPKIATPPASAANAIQGNSPLDFAAVASVPRPLMLASAARPRTP